MSDQMYAQRIENALASLTADVREIAEGMRELVGQPSSRAMLDAVKLLAEAQQEPSPAHAPMVDWVPIGAANFQSAAPLYVRTADGCVAVGDLSHNLNHISSLSYRLEHMVWSKVQGWREVCGEAPRITHVAKITLPQGPVE